MSEAYDLIVVGGGAAGLMAAGTAAKYGKSILILEKNPRMARKVMITGKGRCNLTNDCDEKTFLQNVCTNPKFLMSSLHRFGPQKTMELFESLGVPLKTERGGRVFPVSDKAVDIVDALVGYASGAGVTKVQGSCQALIIKDGRMTGVRCADGAEYLSENVLVATGGKSYPVTGSTGEGYELARQAGHQIIPLRPSLIPVMVEEKWCKDCMGLTLKNVAVSLYKTGTKKPLFHEMGEMLFTHFGVSGPLILSLSALVKEPYDAYQIVIDLKPALTPEQLDQRILRDFAENTNRDFLNSLSALLPRKLIMPIIKLAGIPPEQKVNQISRAQREGLVRLLKNLTLTPTGLLPIEEAVVTAGGVDVKEINPATMESKLVKGLYFAGEVLDLDARTGGFNLQIAFSTGYAVGEKIGEEV